MVNDGLCPPFLLLTCTGLPIEGDCKREKGQEHKGVRFQQFLRRGDDKISLLLAL